MERLKYLVSVQKGKVPKKMSLTDTGNLPIYLAMDYLRNEPKHISFVPDFDKCVLVAKNEILLLWDGSNAGEFMWSKQGVLSSTMAVIKPKKNINKSFLFYQFKEFERYLKDITVGMGIPHVNPQELFNHSFYIPAPEEQTAIANYLDNKTAEIDQLIAQKEQLLELYEEEKTAIINQAVTKGINPDVKFKDSGIDWLGEIPEHWDSIRLKYIGFLYGGLSGKSSKDFNQSVNPDNKPFIPFTNIANNTIIDPNQMQYVVIKEDEKQNRVENGDLFFMMSSENYEDVGKSTILLNELGEAYLNSFCKGFRFTEQGYFPAFINYLLLSHPYRSLLQIEANGFTRINLKIDKINNIDIKAPSIEEQIKIVVYIENGIDVINKKVENTNKLIDLLNEYKQSLISEVVTGKVKAI